MVKDGAKLPNGLRLAMCDVDCGSQTPGMVKKVLAWRSNEPEESYMLWTRLHQANQKVAKALEALVESQGNGQESNGNDRYEALTAATSVIREMIREMSRLSDVPIEPEEQSRLLDACSQVEGVIGGVVPGAGGYDAIALLMEDSKEAVQRLKQCLSEWNQKNAGKEGSIAGKVSLLRVREDNQGIRVEDPSRYDAWLVRREESMD